MIKQKKENALIYRAVFQTNPQRVVHVMNMFINIRYNCTSQKNFPSKIKKLELEVVGLGILGGRILLSEQQLTYLIWKLQLKE